MEAIVLAGGFGTRLKEVVSDIPKPMAPVNGKPFLEYLLKGSEKKGIGHIILAVVYKEEIIKEYFKNKYENIDITYLEELIPLGTGGVIKKALKLAKEEDVFIVNRRNFIMKIKVP